MSIIGIKLWCSVNNSKLVVCSINGIFAFSCALYFEIADFYMNTSFLYIFSLAFVIFSLNVVKKEYSIFSLFILSYVLLFYTYPLSENFIEFDLYYPKWVSILYAQICISSLHLFMFGYMLFSKTDELKFVLVIKKRNLNITFLFFFIISLLSCLVMFKSVGGINASSLSRVDLKYVSGSKIYALWMVYFSSVFYFLIPIFFKFNRRAKWLVWVLIPVVIAFEYIYFIGLRNRTIPIMHLTSIIFSIYLIKFIKLDDADENISYEKLKTKKMLVFFSALGLFGIFIRFARGVFLEGDGELSLSMIDMIKLSIERGDLGYTSLVYDILIYVDSNNIILNGQSYLRAVATFIPSAIWPSKPPTTQSLIGQWLTGVDVVTIPPSIFGDAYINFGVSGFIIFIFFGFFISKMDGLKNHYVRLSVFSIIFVLIFHFVRGAFVNPLIALVFVYLGVFISERIMKPRMEMIE